MSSSVARTTETPASGVPKPPAFPDYAPIPPSALGPALNEKGYHVGRVERNLYWITDGVYQCAFLTTRDGVVLLDAPPTIGNNIQRPINEIASANGVSEYLDAVTNAAAVPVVEKYTGVLGAADVYTASTTFWTMQSLRLDSGLGWPVHP